MNYDKLKENERKIINKLLNNQELTTEEVWGCINCLDGLETVCEHFKTRCDDKVTIIKVPYEKNNFPHIAYYALSWHEGFNFEENKYYKQTAIRVYPKEKQFTVKVWETKDGKHITAESWRINYEYET